MPAFDCGASRRAQAFRGRPSTSRLRRFAQDDRAHGVLRSNGAVDWVHDWAGEYDADDHQRRWWGWIEHELCAAAFRRDGELLRVCRWSECVGDVSGCEWFYRGSDFFGGVKYPKIAARHRWFERSGCSCEWAVSAWVGEQSVLDWRCGTADGDWRGGWVWDWAAELQLSGREFLSDAAAVRQ